MSLLKKLFHTVSPQNSETDCHTPNKNMILVDAYWNDSEDPELLAKLDELLQDCSTRAEEFVKIAELCLPATTNEQLYYASKSYMWAGASYRKEAIHYLEKYIEAGAICENTPAGFREMNNKVYDLRAMSISGIYCDLAKCYAGEYEFDKAIELYKIASNLTPNFPAPIIRLSDMYVKKNQLDKAKSILESATHSEAYEDDDFRSSIDKCLLDINEKIFKGYVYKPRKPK